jgi:hypothetical protein
MWEVTGRAMWCVEIVRYFLNDDFRIRSWPILEISGVGSDSVRIKNGGSVTAENIGRYNNGV